MALDDRLEQGREDHGHRRAAGLVEALGQVGDTLGHRGERTTADRLVEQAAQEGEVVLGQGRGHLDDTLLDPARVGDQDQQKAVLAERDQLDVPDGGAGQRGVLDERHLAGDLGQQAHRAPHDVVEVDGPGQEVLDRPALGGAQRLDLGEPVDEQPVALVGRDPPGAGVGLGDEALLLQDRHVVADRGRRDAQRVPVDQTLRADGLVGAHVVLDDGTQDRELAVVEHGRLLPAELRRGRGRHPRRAGTQRVGVPFYAAPRRTAATRAPGIHALPPPGPCAHGGFATRGGVAAGRRVGAGGHNRGMLIVHVQVHVVPDQVQAFLAATEANATASLEEPGVLRFDVIASRVRRPPATRRSFRYHAHRLQKCLVLGQTLCLLQP